MNYALLIAAILLGYGIGSIPTGWILVKVTTGHEIRYHGSKNIGFTNVARVIGFFAGFVVLVIDIAKSFAVVYWLVPLICGPDSIYLVLAGAGCIIGNRFTFWFQNFKGGKAVATSTGVFLALTPLPLLVALITWLMIIGWQVLRKRDWKKYVFLASISASLALAISYFIFSACYGLFVFAEENLAMTIIVIAVVILMVINHHNNISSFLKSRKIDKAH